ncbi:histidine kinase [Skermanella stibiiresistens SB22]|uniref:Histidine kinase n=1 Tax=Skermanella stibiiresistens SB22 TaxID=1385369 RepID=W9H456_9PROT|nr:AAA family ATPase [Skermanella stibiiresistens]EWY39561.1 histidine kinase [Skermanella stibiiresistens SB22]
MDIPETARDVSLGDSQPIDLKRFLTVAIGLAAALGRVHRKGSLHPDIRPGTVLVDAEGRVSLSDAGDGAVGPLIYWAPERTGRVGRPADARSDLYSVGITLHELLTGSPPFTTSDPMELIHCHIARPPPPPSRWVPDLPAPVEAIILKLQAKTADTRYQTARGLEADLRLCLELWETTGMIAPFPLAVHDAPDRPIFPDRLYGRETATATLTAALDRVAGQGGMELVLVSGYSGVGKSSVVDGLRSALPPVGGLFAVGKFDQFKRDIPYATLARAFQGLIPPILDLPEPDQTRWRDALAEALGPNGQLMVTLIPELERIIGAQPPVQSLPPHDTQVRFQQVFRRFLGVFARPEHPLVLFLDDLQWLDAATLDLIRHLVTGPDPGPLLLVAAYRDNEVGPDHPLAAALASIRHSGAGVGEVTLEPLGLGDIVRLLADTLATGSAAVEPLARLIQDKTGGNPFFSIQFVAALADEGLLVFDLADRVWRWDLERIHAKNLTANVVDLMTLKLRRLPAEQRDVLRHLACLGDGTRASALALVTGAPEDRLETSLRDAVQAGLISWRDGALAFVHDRVQEAAYALVPDDQRAATHLVIGRALTAGMTAAEIEENIFEIVNQLNRGASLIGDERERLGLAAMNLTAGRRAKASTAHAAAVRHLTLGRDLLPADRWKSHYDLAFKLEFDLAECEFLTGDLEAAEDRLAELLFRSADLVDRAAVTWLQVTLHTARGELDQAVGICLLYLRRVGIDWSAHPTRDEVVAEYQPIRKVIEADGIEVGGIERLALSPPMTDRERCATLDVLTAVLPPAFFTDKNLVCLVLCRMVNLSAVSGNSGASCLAYAYLGMVLGPYFGEYHAGYRFGKLGYDLVRERGFDRFKARVGMCFAYHVTPWTKPMRSGLPLLRQAYENASEAGDLTYAGFCSCTLISTLLGAGGPLADVQREAERGLEVVRKARFGLVADIIDTQLQLIRSLRDPASGLSAFEDAEFERRLASHPGLAIAACWYWIRKCQALVHTGDFAGAVAAATKAEPLLWTSGGHFELAEYHFHAALAHAAPGAGGGDRKELVPVLRGHLAQLQIWAANAPDNFEHRAALVAAELARVENRGMDALGLYETAIRCARENGFAQVEALAHGTAARFCQASGFATMAHAHLRGAIEAYRRLGAEAMVRRLSALCPAPALEAQVTEPAWTAEHLDLATVVRTSQAISGEVALDRLIDTLMVITLQHAGADRGLLIVPKSDELWIEAEARAGQGGVTVDVRQVAASDADYPRSVVHSVIATRQAVLIEDAGSAGAFSADEYFQLWRCRSVLCVPLVKQAELIGLLYLENSLTPYVFTPARTAVLKLLASQAALSLENAALGEKEALLKEIHHRVKNNLQLISSLLNLQASRIADPEVAELFADSRNRVRSMALVHENLYRAGNFARIPMEAHVQNLCAHLIRAYGAQSRNVELVTVVEDLRLDIDRAVSCGLIINELVSNALKHAFPDDSAGRIEVSLARGNDGRCALTVRDDGLGMKAGHDDADTLGLQLVHDLTHQLRGAITVNTDSGTSFTITFDPEGRSKGRR